MRFAAQRLVWIAGCLCCLLARAEPAGQTRQEAEARLAEIATEIEQLQRQLESSRARFRDEQSKLRSLDIEIQETALRLRTVRSDIDAAQARLAGLHAERQAYLGTLQANRQELAQQIVAAYRLGHQSRLQLLLNQDSPAKLGRLLAYYDHVSEAQAAQISGLRLALEKLDRLQADIDGAMAGLRDAEARVEAFMEQLQGKRTERLALLAEVSRQIDTDEVRLEELARNQADLEALVQRLTDALADVPSELGQYQHPRALRGSLPMPVEGRVLHAFGHSRTGDMRWQGWLIEAQSGMAVKAIAYGRVAFADWLRGYGLLMIIDHGDGFMSLYGNNESLLYEPGDWVQPGAPVATVGANAGNGQGLYFEIRSQGKAVDPAAWIGRG